MLDTIRNASLPFRVLLTWIEINVSALASKKKMMTNLVWMQLLESKIQEAKSKKDTLKARAQSARYVQWVCFIFSFVLWPKGALQDISYRLWYLMLFFYCEFWSSGLGDFKQFYCFHCFKVLKSSQSRRTGCDLIIVDCFVSPLLINIDNQRRKNCEVELSLQGWCDMFDMTTLINWGHTKFSSAFELDWGPQKELLENGS